MKILIDFFRSSLQVVRENWIPYLVLNLVFFMLYTFGFILAVRYPDSHMQVLIGAKLGQVNGWFSEIVSLYLNHNHLLATLATFSANLLIGTVFMVTLPSCVVPFSGCFVVAFRLISLAFLYGPEQAFNIPILVLATLEGQGYVLGAFAAYLHGMRWLVPARYGLNSRKAGYQLGLRLTGHIYVLVTIVLVIAAIYEPIIATTMSPPTFPHQASILIHRGISDSSVTLFFSGAKIYYQSNAVQESDAKIVGVLLEDMRYFRPSQSREARLSKTDNIFNIELPLDTKYWHDPAVKFHFSKMLATLKRTFPSREYQITAFFNDLSFSRKDTVFQK